MNEMICIRCKGKGKIVPETRTEKVLFLAMRGWTRKDIARELLIPAQSVQDILDKCKILLDSLNHERQPQS